MKLNPPFLLLAGLSLTISLVFAEEEYRHPSGFEPSPVFEDELPARKPVPTKPALKAPDLVHPTPQTPKPQAVAEPPPAISVLAVAAPPPAPVIQVAPEVAPAAAQASTPVLAENYPVVLIALALGGFVVWSARQPKTGVRAAPVTDSATTQTGVARYLADNIGKPHETAPPKTGVARYLTELESVAAPKPRG